MQKIVVILFLYVSSVMAGWMFVNDDGSLSPYDAFEEHYSIPEIEHVPTSKPFIRPKKRVIQQEQIHCVESPKTIYLTFDDGPLAGSSNIISVLSEEQVPATMFMVGKHIDGSTNRKRIYETALEEPLILVANHTYTHANGRYRHFYSSENRVMQDLNKMHTRLEKDEVVDSVRYCRLAGRNVFRLPTLQKDDPGIRKSYGESSKYDALFRAGYQLYGWDYQWSYNPRNGRPKQTPEKMADNIEGIFQKGRTKRPNKFILLMHDFSFQDRFAGREKLARLIHILRDKGWSFATLETY